MKLKNNLFGVLIIFASCVIVHVNIGFAASIYTQQPTYTPPYFAGVVQQSLIDAALGEVNYIRKLAGVPGDLRLNQDYMNKAQHSAVLMDVNDVMSHYPTQPPDMPDDFFQLGYEGSGNSNIHVGWSFYNGVKTGNDSLLVSIKSFMDDSGERNIANLGHRRWLLNPPMQETGFGISSRNGYSAIYVTDRSREVEFDYDYIAWPVATQHPLSYFGSSQAWSVTLHRTVYAKCDDNVAVKLTRQRDGKSWSFEANGGDGYFNISDSIYEECIIFRPDGVGAYESGDSYLIEITGLRTINGDAAVITYSTSFIAESGNPSNRVALRVDGVGGSLDADRTTAEAGETVSITWVADSGYEFEAIRAYRTDDESVEVPLSCVGSVCSFTMPSYSVTVVVSFESNKLEESVGNDGGGDKGGGGCNAGPGAVIMLAAAVSILSRRKNVRCRKPS
jgi:hypothetical protein